MPAPSHADNLYGANSVGGRITEPFDVQEQQWDKMAALGQRIAYIAHELNNPLTSLLGFADLLSRQAADLPPQLAAYLQVIQREAERARQLTQGLLAFSRPKTGEQTLCSLPALAQRAAQSFALQFQEKRITLRLCLEEETPEVWGNSAELQQALGNLLLNAAQAIGGYRESGTIVVTTGGASEGGAYLSVSDDGPGIRPEHRARLFEPFFSTKPPGEGTGLGLAICGEILRAHQATLDIHSEYGHGASFQIAFPPPASPALRLTTSALPSPDATRPPAPSEPPNPARWRLALLDDEPLIRELVGEMLMEQGHTVVSFDSPAAAVEAFCGEEYDALLSDVNMPEMGGRELYARIQERCPQRAARILFLTGDILSEEAQAFFVRTGSLYLPKPFSLPTLLNRLETLLRAEPIPPDHHGEGWERRQAA